MKSIQTEWTLLTAMAVVLVACGHKKDAVGELENAANAMAKLEVAQPAAAPSQPPAANQASPSPETPAAPPPAQQMKQALAAYKAGNLEDAVIRLQILRATPVLTPDQRMALNDSIAAVMTEVYAMAEKGDSRAIAAVMQYEKIQTTPHR